MIHNRRLALARMVTLAPLLVLASSGATAPAEREGLPRDDPPSRPPPRQPPPVPTQAELDAQRKRARRAARHRHEAGYTSAPVTTRKLPIPPPGAFCAHTAMIECCPPLDGKPGCGHFACPCGISWDESFEGHAP